MFNRIVYIGATSFSLPKRLNNHIYNSLYFKSSKKDKWIMALIRNKMKPTIHLIETCDETNWEQVEKFWIKEFKEKGYELLNSTVGGRGCNGMKMPNSAKEILSKQRIGVKQPNKVFKSLNIQSESAKAKRAESLKKTHREGLAKPLSRQKSYSREILQYTLDETLINEFVNVQVASELTGVKRTSITENLRGANKTACGYVFKYKHPKI